MTETEPKFPLSFDFHDTPRVSHVQQQNQPHLKSDILHSQLSHTQAQYHQTQSMIPNMQAIHNTNYISYSQTPHRNFQNSLHQVITAPNTQTHSPMISNSHTRTHTPIKTQNSKVNQTNVTVTNFGGTVGIGGTVEKRHQIVKSDYIKNPGFSTAPNTPFKGRDEELMDAIKQETTDTASLQFKLNS